MFSREYAAVEPVMAEVQAWAGLTLLEFGADWCGHCQAAQPLLAEALAYGLQLRHMKIADGRGRPLGRAFRVKLWPTLILLRDGVELARVARPQQTAEIRQLLAVAQ